MSYESPIAFIYNDIMPEIEKAQEGMVLKAVTQCGVDVNKDELIKALEYDRDQYKKGYSDAKSKIGQAIEKYCTLYCPHATRYFSEHKDVDAATEHLEQKCEGCPLGDYTDSVFRGEWIEEDDGYRCSVCEKAVYGCNAEIYAGEFKYCPYCGVPFVTTDDDFFLQVRRAENGFVGVDSQR